PDEPRLGNRRIDDALGAQFVQQTLGRPEDAPVLADVFTEDEHRFVPFHLLGDGLRDRPSHRQPSSRRSRCHGGILLSRAPCYSAKTWRWASSGAGYCLSLANAYASSTRFRASSSCAAISTSLMPFSFM